MGSSSRSLPRPFVLMLTMLLATLAIVTEPASSAQVERDGPSAKYTVTVNLCLAPGCTELADAITPVDGVAVEASNADDGEVFGSCVTGADGPGTCTLDVRLVPMLAFTFDESTIPDGYVLDANPQIVPNQSDEPAAVSTLGVLLYPEGGFPPDGETRQIPVRAMICGDASCADYQEGIFGVEITATDVDTGAMLDSCVTDAGNQIGGCVLAVPSASTFSLGWDESAIPDGLVSYGDPIPGPIASGGTDGYTLAFFAPERDAPAPTAVPPLEPPPVIVPDGLPAGLYAGSCAGDGLGERIVQLNGPAVPEGAVQGATDAIPVGIGFTVIDVPFRDMLNGGRVIAIFDDDGETMIACGAVGGVLDVNGAMSMGLAPAGDSGAVGVAYLNARNDATATGISIFLMTEIPGGGETPVP